MKEIDRIPFTHRGKDYEVSVAVSGFRLEARTMLNGKPANRVTCSCDIDHAMDVRSMTGQEAIDLLVAKAKETVTRPQLARLS